MKRILAYLLISFVAAGVFASESPADTNGKSIVVIGDSYVRNHQQPWSLTWHARAAERLGMYYRNMGINGNCIAFDRTDRGFGRPLTERVAEMPPVADCVLVIAGHNDAGMIAAGESRDYFRGKLDELCRLLKARYPQAAIGFVTPWDVDRECFDEVIADIKEICGANGIAVFDTAACGIEVNNAEFRDKYFQNHGVNDTAHLNADGHALLIGRGAEFIASLFKDK